MNTLLRIGGWLLNIAVALWTAACNVTTTTGRQTRAFINTMLIILGVEAGLLLIGFIFNIKGFIVFAAVVASLVVLVAWKASDLAVRFISAIAGRIPLARTVVPPATDELKKLLSPMLTISLFLAFIGAIAAIKGPAYFTWSDMMIWTAVILTTEIFTLYVNSKMKMFGWAMIGLMYYLLIGNYLWPIQAQGFVSWVERSTVKKSMVAMENTKDYELVVIPNNVPLYELGWGGKFSSVKTTTATETKAKLVGRKDDPTSKEAMYEVILPVQEGLYVGGETFYVPARLTQPAAINLFSPAEAEASLPPREVAKPNYRIYPPGEHDLGKFKAGEQTDYWITTEPGKTSNLGFLATNKMFKIVFEDGHTVNVWEKQGGELFDRKDKFKIIAVEDVDITMVVK